MKLSEAVKHNNMASLIHKIQSYSWDHGVCPVCGSNNVKETSYHDLTGESEYKCRACGARGHGQWGEDTPPTLGQIAQYERERENRTIYAHVVEKQEPVRKLTFVERAISLLTRD